MSTSILSAGEPGAPRCSEAANGSNDAAADLAVALRALENASERLETLHHLGEVVSDLLDDSPDEIEAVRAVQQGQRALTMQACNAVFRALKQLGQREAA